MAGEDEQPVVLPVITVTADPSNEIATQSTTATKTDTPLIEIPQSVQVVPRTLLDDQKALTLTDAVRNVSGVRVPFSAGGRGEQFVIRGFSSFETIFKNRFRSNAFTGDLRTATELQNIERIEILKGPASLLYGNLDPGGAVHLFTKQPLDRFYAAPELTIGSFNFYRPAIDVSGPIDAGKTLRYRLNGAYELARSFRDFVETERLFVAPVLSWTLRPGTTLTLEGEHLDDIRPIDRGLVAAGRGVADVPASRFLGDPDRRNEFDQTLVSLVLDHQFGPKWSLRAGYRYGLAHETYDSIEARGNPRADGRTLPLAASKIPQTIQAHQLQGDLVGKFSTGLVGHTLLIGLELARLEHDTTFRDASAGTIDIFDPIYEFPVGTFATLFDQERRGDVLGIYLQDQVQLLEPLTLVLGTRFDVVDRRSLNRLNGRTTELDDTDVSPRVGLVWPVPPVALYASWSRSFQPQSGILTIEGAEPFEPERGEAYEVGVKTDTFGGKLVSTLALFQITKENVLTADPNDTRRSIAVGEQRSRGIEVDIAARPLPGWNIIAAYAFTDAEIRKDNRFKVGSELHNVPEHGGSLWTTYELQDGWLRGLGFGAGLFVAGERAGDLNNSFDLPEYARTDAAIFYRKGIVQAALNVKNVFDVEYFEGAQSRSSVVPGSPFTVFGTIGLRF
ncbi:MAG: TonB-dependent siderophore receptor [Gammaproteobacteria bacterium]